MTQQVASPSSLLSGHSRERAFEDGGDSDGKVGPFFDVAEGEEKHGEARDEAQLESLAASNLNASDDSPPPLASEEFTKMKVKDLKLMLVESKLKASGNKKALIAWLMDSISSLSSPIYDDECEVPEGFHAACR